MFCIYRPAHIGKKKKSSEFYNNVASLGQKVELQTKLDTSSLRYENSSDYTGKKRIYSAKLDNNIYAICKWYKFEPQHGLPPLKVNRLKYEDSLKKAEILSQEILVSFSATDDLEEDPWRTGTEMRVFLGTLISLSKRERATLSGWQAPLHVLVESLLDAWRLAGNTSATPSMACIHAVSHSATFSEAGSWRRFSCSQKRGKETRHRSNLGDQLPYSPTFPKGLRE